MPRLFIIAGCNGSGKTTASYSVLPEMLECTQYVNSDEFAKSIAPFDPDSASVSAGRFMLISKPNPTATPLRSSTFGSTRRNSLSRAFMTGCFREGTIPPSQSYAADT